MIFDAVQAMCHTNVTNKKVGYNVVKISPKKQTHSQNELCTGVCTRQLRMSGDKVLPLQTNLNFIMSRKGTEFWC